MTSTTARPKPRYTADEISKRFPSDPRLMSSPEGDLKGLEDLRALAKNRREK